MRPWLILRNVSLEGPDLLEEVLRAEHIPYEVADASAAGAIPRSPEGIGGLVILGGPMGVYEEARYPVLREQRALLRAATEHDLPVLGICLGAQLLASAFGAAVYPGSGPEIGWAPISLTPEGHADPVLAPLADAPPVFHLHGDTFDRPGLAVHLACSELYEMQAFRLGRRAYGLQFHLEFSATTVERVVSDSATERDLRALRKSPEAIIRESPGRARALAPRARNVFQRFVRLA